MAYTYSHPRPMVTVDVVLFTANKPRWVLLIKRKNEPFKGKWALPGGFVGIDEELLDAALRELKEETGVTGARLKQVRAFDTLGRDPRGRVITIAFTGTIDKVTPAADTDATDARWFPLDDLPDVTFDHADIIAAAAAIKP